MIVYVEQIRKKLVHALAKLGCLGTRERNASTEAVVPQPAFLFSAPEKLFKQKRRHVRGNTLLREVAAAIAGDIWRYSTAELVNLPADLGQVLLDELISMQKLTQSSMALFSLQYIYHLDLASYPRVTDNWLHFIQQPSLVVINLSDCTQITDQALVELKRQTQLRELRLDYCSRITDRGIAQLTEMTGLQILSLEHCKQLTHVSMRSIACLTSLQTLHVGSCRNITGLQYIKCLEKLKSLNVGWCGKITNQDVLAIARLTSLTHLTLSKTAVEDTGLLAVSNLPELKVLDLAGCSNLTDASLDSMWNLTSLASLNLMWTWFTEEGLHNLGDLRSLGELNLTEVQGCTNATLSRIANCTQLRFLNLDTCSHVSDAGLDHLRSLTNLEELDLSETSISDKGIPYLYRLPSLTALSVSYTDLTDIGLGHIAQLTDLQSLSIDTRGITEEGTKFLTSLEKLRHLDIFGIRLPDEALEDIGLKNLRMLRLDQNSKLSDNCLLACQAMSHLKLLNMSQTKISMSGLVYLQTLQELETLIVRNTRLKAGHGVRIRQILPQLQTIEF